MGAVGARGVVRAGAQHYHIWVRDPGWFRVGDMMVDGVIPLGEALRPLGLPDQSSTAFPQLATTRFSSIDHSASRLDTQP